VEFVKTKYENKVDISEKIKPKQWEILPKRPACRQAGGLSRGLFLG
jgi:hypothetical protein